MRIDAVKVTILIIMVFFLHCGSKEEIGPEDVCSSAGGPTECYELNSERLIGTPFEGMAIGAGDSLDPEMFLCAQYRTNTIDSFPTQIFVALGSDIEDAIVQEGIDIANDAIGFTAYEMTNAWSDDVRVIYFVDEVDGTANAVGKTYANDFTFDGFVYAKKQSTDWVIVTSVVNKWVIAHELGHATGIEGHFLIDYENDAMLDLEEDSLMEANLPSAPELTDYNFMMSMQGQIMLDHVGESGTIDHDPCE